MIRKSIHAVVLMGALMSCLLGVSARAQEKSSEADVRALLKAMSVDEQYRQVQTMMTQQIKPALEGISRNLPEESRATFLAASEKMLANLAKSDPKEMIDETVKVYAKHYSPEEIKGLLAFYGTPLGKKMLAETPAITTELMSVSMQWNQAQANKILQDLLKQFPGLNSAPMGNSSMEHQHQ